MNTAPDRLPSRERVRWQCRRGLLELDLLLDAFVEKAYDDLTDADKLQLLALLETPDQLLQEWLLGQGVPEEVAMARMVERIRESY